MDDSPTTRLSLLARLRSPRDERAWEEFAAIYGPLLVRLARRRGLQAADAADLAQEVFGAVASAIDGYDPDPAKGSFRAWLFRIARNLTVNFLVKRRRHPPGPGGSDAAALLEAQPAPEDPSDFELEYRRQLFVWAADRARGEFTEAAWRAFWMAGVEGRPAAEVAAELKTTVGTVYVHKSRVMARLRREIERVEGREADDR
ncbi:ECF RNA polymerase sigma factor SigE [Aquisphaera giovannonii]|uniref:ECF RNA polymerase sigma factor SigE n=1 Tax=Aquisphaera giovannonii TaxID=406548 RepID=A0A5B9WEN0_9BACT|nr:sigma-70 family RNA polymerase sigma factor [Aquisphaera giovannonii]QEH39108.1 ECF RNA polymerase sigma factor SigE [Aquisphaera giovannonii]